MSPSRFAALTNKMAAAARPAIAVRRIGNTLAVSFSTHGLVMIDMAISLSRWCNGWRNSGRRNDSRHHWPRRFSELLRLRLRGAGSHSWRIQVARLAITRSEQSAVPSMPELSPSHRCRWPIVSPAAATEPHDCRYAADRYALWTKPRLHI